MRFQHGLRLRIDHRADIHLRFHGRPHDQRLHGAGKQCQKRLRHLVLHLILNAAQSVEGQSPGQAVVKHGVTIVGYTDLASRMARQSSTLYGTNLFRLTEELCKTKDGVIHVNMQDDAIRGLTVVKDGEVTWPAPPLPAAAP